ncbi:MAG: hypothetical protein M2R45_01634 [Verrucomicrobia subdivision 3 bacterium]|nr:hypothetical protein [Limisphaerales bacterium]MCS1412785.1 hypothetical protein [Limisphaerales bacterium]
MDTHTKSPPLTRSIFSSGRPTNSNPSFSTTSPAVLIAAFHKDTVGGTNRDSNVDTDGGGSAEYLRYSCYYALAGPPMSSGTGLTEDQLPNELWNDPGDPKKRGAGR